MFKFLGYTLAGIYFVVACIFPPLFLPLILVAVGCFFIKIVKGG